MIVPADTPLAQLSPKASMTGWRMLSAFWCILVIACASVMVYSSFIPGVRAPHPLVLPDSVQRYQSDGAATVFIALHPHCPCSRATIANLERALADSTAATNIVVFLYAPADRDAEWVHTDTVQRLSFLPQVHTVVDADGQAATALGMHTSGEFLIYNRAGALAFAGGITPSRGHEGDCAGLASLSALLAGEHAGVAATETYGCPLSTETTLSTCADHND